jgi:MoxR-like ATPase
MVNQVAAEWPNSAVVDLRMALMDPTDIKGVPYYSAGDNTMKWATPSELPTAEFAAKHDVIFLFLDELNSAPPAVQAAAYQLILNRKVGQYTLPENVV